MVWLINLCPVFILIILVENNSTMTVKTDTIASEVIDQALQVTNHQLLPSLTQTVVA